MKDGAVCAWGRRGRRYSATSEGLALRGWFVYSPGT